MPTGCRECSLKIQLSSIRLRLDVEDASNLGVHHSNTENCICLWLCPSLLKCLETGVICPSFCTKALCSYILFLRQIIYTLFIALGKLYILYSLPSLSISRKQIFFSNQYINATGIFTATLIYYSEPQHSEPFTSKSTS